MSEIEATDILIFYNYATTFAKSLKPVLFRGTSDKEKKISDFFLILKNYTIRKSYKLLPLLLWMIHC